MIDAKNRNKFYGLANRLSMTGDPKYKELIKNLNNLEYDDFANEQFATPKLQLINDLTDLGLFDEVERVKNGDYDQ